MFLGLIETCVFLLFLFYVVCLVWFDCDVTLGFSEKFRKPIDSLKGKVAFITGASSGIGEFTAIVLAKGGVRLVLAARRDSELERVKRECLVVLEGKLKPDDIFVLPMNVVRYDLHQKYFDDAIKHFGQVDILINNAGRSQRAQWENIDLSVDKEMFDLNVFSVVNLSRIAVKYFEKEKREGYIAVTSSTVGVMVLPFSGTYNGTKPALHTYGQTTSPTDNRLSAERCGHLCAVALANKLDEPWMGVWPLITIMYISVYFPVLFKMLLKILGPQILYKLRDSKDDLKLPSTGSHKINVI